MRHLLVATTTLGLLMATPTDAGAQERVLTGVAIGAGTGAILAGPPGALVGGVLGGVIGGPRLSRRYKECWYDKAGMRHCRNY